MPYIILSRNSGKVSKVLDVPGGSSDNGVRIQQYALNEGPNQQWEQISLSPDNPEGPYLIVNVNSSRALDVMGASMEAGAPIIQFRVHGGGNQRWWRRDVPHLGGPPVYLYLSVNSGMALDVSGASRNDHAPIIQYPYHEGRNQQWEVSEPGVVYPFDASTENPS